MGMNANFEISLTNEEIQAGRVCVTDLRQRLAKKLRSNSSKVDESGTRKLADVPAVLLRIYLENNNSESETQDENNGRFFR